MKCLALAGENLQVFFPLVTSSPHAVSAAPISVAIADDHPAVLEGLAAVLEHRGGFTVGARAATGREVRGLIEREPPQVLVLDLMLGNEDGLALVKDVAGSAPAVRIVVFSLQPEEVYAERCLRAGAHAYVMKQEPVETLFAAIRAVAGEGVFFSSRVSAMLLGSVAGAARKAAGGYAQLTDRELQIFRLIGLALTSRQIAEKLGVSVKTVEAHRENIKNKLDLESGPALVARAALWVRDGGVG